CPLRCNPEDQADCRGYGETALEVVTLRRSSRDVSRWLGSMYRRRRSTAYNRGKADPGNRRRSRAAENALCTLQMGRGEREPEVSRRSAWHSLTLAASCWLPSQSAGVIYPGRSAASNAAPSRSAGTLDEPGLFGALRLPVTARGAQGQQVHVLE